MSGFWTIPNILSLSRLPLAAVLVAAIAGQFWAFALAVFLIASLTDWLDGYLARRWNQGSPLGRVLDPLTDKVLVCAALIALLPSPESALAPWMVALVVGRELLVTGLRGVVEQTGRAFGADWSGKIKMVSQCVAVAGILLAKTIDAPGLPLIRDAAIWVMTVATAVSGVQYVARASRSE